MRFIETFQAGPFADTVVSLLAAFVLGTLIGAERQYRQRTAGLRTNVLVAVGAAAFVDLGMRIAGSAEAVRVISYVVSGVGFLGAGVIMKEGMNVRGLNTAATLWCSAAVGSCTGADMLAEGVLLTVLIIAGNTLLRPLVNAINRIPINEAATEATYEVRLSVDAEAVPRVRERLVDALEAAQYPVGDVQVVEHADAPSDVIAVLVSTAVSADELDVVLARMEHVPGVLHATWESAPAIDSYTHGVDLPKPWCSRSTPCVDALLSPTHRRCARNSFRNEPHFRASSACGHAAARCRCRRTRCSCVICRCSTSACASSASRSRVIQPCRGNDSPICCNDSPAAWPSPISASRSSTCSSYCRRRPRRPSACNSPSCS